MSNSAPQTEPEAAAPAAPPKPARSTAWIFWATIPIAILAMTGLAIWQARGFIRAEIAASLGRETESVRRQYQIDSKAARDTLGAGYSAMVGQIETAESNIRKLFEAQDVLHKSVDTYMRNNVSPAAMKKIVDDVAAVRGEVEKIQASVTALQGTGSATARDLAKLSEYLNGQLYPAIVALQEQAKSVQSAVSEASSMPVGVLVPSTSDPQEQNSFTVQPGVRMPVRP